MRISNRVKKSLSWDLKLGHLYTAPTFYQLNHLQLYPAWNFSQQMLEGYHRSERWNIFPRDTCSRANTKLMKVPSGLIDSMLVRYIGVPISSPVCDIFSLGRMYVFNQLKFFQKIECRECKVDYRKISIMQYYLLFRAMNVDLQTVLCSYNVKYNQHQLLSSPSSGDLTSKLSNEISNAENLRHNQKLQETYLKSCNESA